MKNKKTLDPNNIESIREYVKDNRLFKDVEPEAVFALADKLFAASVSSGYLEHATLVLPEEARQAYSVMLVAATDIEAYKAELREAVTLIQQKPQ
jgi:hypothetical protein